MALENCRESIKTAIGRDLTPEESRDVAREAKSIKARLDFAQGNPEQIKAIMDDVAARGRTILAKARIDAASQWETLQKLGARRDAVSFSADNPAEWLKGLFHGSNFKYEGAQNSVGKDVQREGNMRAEGLEADLYKAGVHNFADSKDIRVKSQINNAIWELQKGTKLPDVATKFGKDAATTADIFLRHSKLAHDDLNNEGAWIGTNSDRTFRRTFDANKIAKAGGFDYGSNAARDYWAKEQYARMDWDKAYDGTLAGATEKERMDLLRRQFGRHVSGEHTDITRNFGQGSGGRAGSRFSYQRENVFNSPADDLAFHEAYGRGSTMLENRMAEQRDGGKVIALMRHFGTRPEENVRKFTTQWVDKLNDTDPVKAKALSDQMKSEMGNTWKLLTGQVGHPADNFVSRLEASARHTIGIAKTGLSIFSLPNDMALRSAQMADYSGGRFKGSVLAQMKQFAEAGMNLSKEDKRWLMAQAGSRWEDATRPIDPNLIDHQGFGAIHKYVGLVAKYAGHGLWDNTFRVSNLVNDGNIFAREMKLPFSKVTFQEGMKRFGIGEAEWNVLREMETSKLSDGREVLMPQHVTDAPLEKFKTLTAATSDSALSRARGDLAAKYRNLLGEMSERSTSATSIENQAAMHLGTINADSPYAIPIKWLLQLKGWGINYIRNHLDRELRGGYENYTTVGQAVRDMMIGKNNRAIVGLSRMIGKGMAIAYVTNSMRQLASGQTPLDPFDFDSDKWGGFINTPGAQAAAGAFAKQGLGLYTDWLLSQGAPNQTTEEKVFDMIAGPVGGTAAKILDIAGAALIQSSKAGGMTDEQRGRDLQRLYSTGWRLIPGTETWYSKAILDALIYNNISETLNEGYKERLQDRAQKRGQSYWNQ